MACFVCLEQPVQIYKQIAEADDEEDDEEEGERQVPHRRISAPNRPPPLVNGKAEETIF
jgi:hypothetical protein